MDEFAATTSGSSWESWIQGVGGKVIDQYASANWTQPFELQKLRIQAMGNDGYYTEGQAAPVQRSLGGISPTVMLLAGAAVVALLMLKD
jgi:hypothetical protein